LSPSRPPKQPPRPCPGAREAPGPAPHPGPILLICPFAPFILSILQNNPTQRPPHKQGKTLESRKIREDKQPDMVDVLGGPWGSPPPPPPPPLPPLGIRGCARGQAPFLPAHPGRRVRTDPGYLPAPPPFASAQPALVCWVPGNSRGPGSATPPPCPPCVVAGSRAGRGKAACPFPNPNPGPALNRIRKPCGPGSEKPSAGPSASGFRPAGKKTPPYRASPFLDGNETFRCCGVNSRETSRWERIYPLRTKGPPFPICPG